MTNSEPVASLKRLNERLAALAPPRPGFRRVFRGQTRDHGSMLPSGLRPGESRASRLWGFSLKSFADNVAGTVPEDLAFEAVFYWFEMIAQHYGPLSPFLDVTSSVEVALWFAQHKAHVNRTARYAFVQGDTRLRIECPTLYFTPHDEAPGWLFVIDAEVCDRGLPGHGQLVDLARGPSFVSGAPRVQRQEGALVAAEADLSGGDLSSLYACDPIPVAGPFEGAPFLDREAAYLFPPPDEDPWYAQLLRAPLIPQPDAEDGYVYGQSLGVYIVAPDGSPDHAEPFIARQIKYLCPLTRLRLRASTSLTMLRNFAGAHPEGATYIYLEMPLHYHTGPASVWNPALLVLGLDSTTEPEDAVDGALFPAVSLTNVLIEFSPLEWAFRDTLTDVGYVRQFRAIWLVRRGRVFWMTVFSTSSPDAEVTMHSTQLEYDAALNAFLEKTEAGERVPLVDAKPLYLALMVLRDLSRPIKPEPFSMMSSEKTDFLVVRGQTAKLVRPRTDVDDVRLHFVRYMHSNTRYEGPLPLDEVPPLALIELNKSYLFECLPGIRAVLNRVRKVKINGTQLGLTPQTAAGDRQTAIDRLLRELDALESNEE